MKKSTVKWTRLLTALALCVLLVYAPPSALADSYEKIYRDTLDRFYRLIADCSPEHTLEEGETGIWEVLMSLPDGEALSNIGYALTDLSGDGVPELLISAISYRDGGHSYGNAVYALYTCADGLPQYVCESWARSCYRIMDDGRFLYEGSSGAMYSIFGVYSLSPAAVLQCEDYYFTYEKDENFEEIGYYYNQTADWDPAYAQEIASDDFDTAWNTLSRHIGLIELTPFSAYTAAQADASGAAVSVCWSVTSSDSTSPMVSFTAQCTVRDFRILALTLERMAENGSLIFSTATSYALNTLEAGNSVSTLMTFDGTVPQNGISYVDESGITQRFIVEISGRDGSLCMTAF